MSRSRSEQHSDAMLFDRPNLVIRLSPEILEHIGKRLDSLTSVGLWNSVLAKRYKGFQRLMHDYPDLDYANVAPMINPDLIHGTRHMQLQVLPEAETEPLLLQVFNSPATRFRDMAMVPDIRRIYALFPGAMDWIGSNAETVLHSATIPPWDGTMIFKLLPDGVQRFDDTWLCRVNLRLDTPLSNYLQHHADPRVVDLLMDTEAVVLTMQDSLGNSPFHHIVQLNTDHFNLDSFMNMKRKMHEHELDAKVLKLRNSDRETALHTALRDTNVLLSNVCAINYLIPRLVDAKQNVLRMRNRRDISLPEDEFEAIQRDTPLHMAMAMNLSFSTLQLLIDRDQDVLVQSNGVDAAREGAQDTPMHMAIKTHRSIDVIKLMTDADSRVMLCRNNMEDTPLLCALRHSKTAHLTDSVNARKVLTYLVKTGLALDPDYLMIKGYCDTTPLHFAVALEAPLYVIKMLADSDARQVLHVAKISEAETSDKDFEHMHDDTPLHVEVKGRCLFEVIKVLVDACGQALLTKNLFGFTPLHCAIKQKRRFEVIEYLVGKDSGVLLVDDKADDEDEDSRDMIPLVYGILQFANIKILRLLVDADLKVFTCNLEGGCGRDPLRFLLDVIDREHVLPQVQQCAYVTRVMDFLLPYFTRVSPDMRLTRDYDGFFTPLEMYLRDKNRCPGLLHCLIDENADVLCIKNVKDEYPFMRAIRTGLSYEMIIMLFSTELLGGTDIGPHKGTVLHYIAEHCNDVRIFEFVVSTGIVTLDSLDRRGRTALHVALIKKLNHEILKLLCDDVKYPHLKYTPMKITEYNQSTATPLHLALHRKYHWDIVGGFIDADGHVLQTTDECRRTPLHVSARSTYQKSTHHLLLRGGKASGKQIQFDIWGMTPLMYGICNRAPPEVLELMIDTEHRVLSAVATVNGRVNNTLESFETAGTCPEFLDKTVFNMIGMTPLHKAAQQGLDSDFLKVLLPPNNANTPDIRELQVVGNQAGFNGKTPLHFALEHHFYNANMIEMLMDQKRDIVNVADVNGCLPLHIAAKHNHLYALKQLVSYNTVSAETLARRDENGNSPLMYSIYHHCSIDVMKMLIDLQSRAILPLPDCLESVGGKINKRTPLQCLLMLEGLCGKFRRQSLATSGTDAAPILATDMHVEVDIGVSHHTAVDETPRANSDAQSEQDHDAESEQDHDTESEQDHDTESEQDHDTESEQDHDTESEQDHDAEHECDRDKHSTIDLFAVDSYTKSTTNPLAPVFSEMIRVLTDPEGLVLLELNEARCLPIHEVLLMGCPLDVIALVVPPALTVRADGSTTTLAHERYVEFLCTPGFTPLHQALLAGANMHVIKFLCHHFASVLQQLLVAETSANENALDIAIRLELPINIIPLLIDDAETVLSTGQNGGPATARLDLPVQVILKRSENLPCHITQEYCGFLLGHNHNVLSKRNSELQTPLHTALLTHALFERNPQQILFLVRDSLLQSNVEICTMQDVHGNTPLHLAMDLLMAPSSWSTDNAQRFQAGSRIRQKIVKLLADSGAILKQDEHGKLPLHRAIQAYSQHHTLSLAAFHPTFLIDSPQKRVLCETDKQNETPLHLAVCLGCVDTDLLQWLTDADEQVLSIPNTQGKLPLHTAVDTGIATVNQLVFLSGTKQQQLCKVNDSHGQTPLCAAVYNCANTDIVRFLLFSIHTEQDRALALRSVNKCYRTLLHVAMKRNAVLNTVKMLIGKAQDPLTMVDNLGDMPLHLLFQKECVLLQHPGIDYVKLVSKFIDGEKKALVCQNIDGNTPLHLALFSIPREMADVFIQVMTLLIPDQSIFDLRNKIGQSILDIDPCFYSFTQSPPADRRLLLRYKEWLQGRHSD